MWCRSRGRRRADLPSRPAVAQRLMACHSPPSAVRAGRSREDIMRRRDVLAGLGAAWGASALGTEPVRAQAWPSRTITMVVPFPPGGQGDLAARPVAQGLSRLLGQSV